MKIIGHRGAAGIAVENSKEGINKALQLGVSYIEIDVWKTIDNEIVVFHDINLLRLTSKNQLITNLSFDDLCKLKLSNGETIPTLNEIIQLIKDKNIKLLVEVKDESAFEETLNILNHELSNESYIIGSFFHKQIYELKKEYPQLKTAIMFEGVLLNIDKYLNIINPEYIVTSIETFNSEICEIIKNQDRKLVFYTINNQTELELALKVKPYAIITDYPNVFINIDN